ncbi:hypothetical protein DFJ73DRAFT_487729 [Zopfochytrium polystomum]|nr:hypothetical protein DFJ73DRAFT_487729 [Zopfochytrium polystomum]
MEVKHTHTHFTSKMRLLSTTAVILTAAAAATAAKSITIVQPVAGTIFTMRDFLNITWTLDDPTLSASTLLLDLQDTRHGAEVVGALSPSPIPASALRFGAAGTVAALFPGVAPGSGFVVNAKVVETGDEAVSALFVIKA